MIGGHTVEKTNDDVREKTPRKTPTLYQPLLLQFQILIKNDLFR